jgi:hypothetical protein
MEVIGIGLVMMLPIIGLGITLILSAEATKDIGNDVDI